MTPKKSIYLAVVIGLVLAFLLPACVSYTTVETKATPIPEQTVAPTIKKILNMWYSESPTLLNPHLSSSIRDWEPARIVYEPLASFNQDGILVPILASEIPTLENGGLSTDGKSVTWKMREGLRWSDGQDLTADDVVFTYNFVQDPDVKAITQSNYALIKSVEALDKLTIKITFKDPTPAWSVPFVGNSGVILPKHIFESYKGKDIRSAPISILPIGSGPYRIVEPGIKPQEVILLGSQVVKTTKIVYERNPYYRFPEKLFFDQIIWRGGGTVSEAARLLYKEGTLDVAYTFETISPAELQTLQTDKGKQVTAFGTIIARINLNRSDPNKASDDQEFSSLKVPHPLFSDKKVRQAIAYAIDRESIAKLYGANGQPIYVNLVAPPQYKSSNEFYKYDLAKANALLDEAGYLDKDGDGFREKDGVKMKLVFQGVANTINQEAQKIVQRDLKKIGIDLEIKIVDSSIMFVASNPDSANHFNADMLIMTIRSSSPDPSGYMSYWTCSSIPQKSNNWTGINFERWCNPKYDKLLEKAKVELDPKKRQEMFIQLNDMLTEDVVMVPVVWRANGLGVSKRLEGLDPTPWDSVTWNIESWYFVSE